MRKPFGSQKNLNQSFFSSVVEALFVTSDNDWFPGKSKSCKKIVPQKNGKMSSDKSLKPRI
jgi:hypothetical protein